MEQIGEGSAGRVHRGVRKSDQKEADRSSWGWLGGEGGFLLGIGLGLLCRWFVFHLHNLYNLCWIRLVSLSTFHVGELGQLRLLTKRNRQIFSEMITWMMKNGIQVGPGKG